MPVESNLTKKIGEERRNEFERKRKMSLKGVEETEGSRKHVAFFGKRKRSQWKCQGACREGHEKLKSVEKWAKERKLVGLSAPQHAKQESGSDPSFEAL